MLKKIILLSSCTVCFSIAAMSQSFFTTSTYANDPKGVGANSIFGWGENFDRTFDVRPNPHPYMGTMTINYHTGLTFSAHSYYGGIRFYNQGYPNPYDTASGSTMVMSINNNNVGIGTTTPVNNLDVHKAYVGSGLYEASTIGLSTDNSISSWTLGSVSGYVAAGLNNAIAGYPGGLLFKTKNPDNGQNSLPTTKMVLDANGNVGIGTTSPDAKLTVNGTVHSKEVKVDVNIAPDYVFEKDYKLKTLTEVQKYIAANKHLPEIPSAKNMEQNGVDLSDMNMKLLKKVEELTLYLIEMQKQNSEMKQQIQQVLLKNNNLHITK